MNLSRGIRISAILFSIPCLFARRGAAVSKASQWVPQLRLISHLEAQRSLKGSISSVLVNELMHFFLNSPWILRESSLPLSGYVYLKRRGPFLFFEGPQKIKISSSFQVNMIVCSKEIYSWNHYGKDGAFFPCLWPKYCTRLLINTQLLLSSVGLSFVLMVSCASFSKQQEILERWSHLWYYRYFV